MRVRLLAARVVGALTTVVTLGGALAGVTEQAGAQDARLAAIRDDATRARVRAFVDAARARGTPTDPLVSRALEGVAFRADARRIEQAMAVLEKRLLRSRELLGPASVDELSAAADALASGVPESSIRELRRIAPHRTITVEIGVLTELVAKGVAPKRAAAMVRDLMAAGATGAQLTELNAAIQQDVALGVSPVAALELRGRGVMSLLPPSAAVTAAQRRP